jgi:hypothetical protein
MVRHCRTIDGRLRDLSLELATAIRSADYLAQMRAGLTRAEVSPP